MSVTVQGRKVAPGQLDASLRLEFTYSIIELPRQKAKTLDKRSQERLRTRLRAGQLTDRRNKAIADCLIQDRSRTGARLRLAHDRPLPKSFILVDETSQAQFRAELAWQQGRDAGVRLVTL
jgi:hypothetical protein